WSATKGLKLFVVLDEAWKVAKEDTSDAVMIVREGRKYQFGLIVASQNPTDISESIFSNVGTTFILRVKFERFLDYLQATLNFSNFMRQEISKFGVGQCAVNMAFQSTVQFSETFLLEMIDGEEPLLEYFLDLKSLYEDGRGDMAKSYSFEKNELKRRLRSFGIDETHIEEVANMFEKSNKHLDVLNFVIALEKYGLARSNIASFLKDIGVDDSTLINIFSKVDFKKLGMEDKEITQVVLSE
ncbi:MAG: ATP-binding protein, partial [Candidatus Micrarchaeota archaeon]|nr:ATP-binding protein [Candidatus Micrarchaeota archaeon]